jgi:hypothetical protein
MGSFIFPVSDFYRVKVEGWYPWPWSGEPKRMIKLYPNDILTKDPKEGTYTRQNGLGVFGIVLDDNEVTFHPGEVVHLKI